MPNAIHSSRHPCTYFWSGILIEPRRAQARRQLIDAMQELNRKQLGALGDPAIATHIGATDDFGYNITENPVSVHDFHATMLRCLGIDHTQLTYRFEGRDYRLTDVSGEVVTSLLV